MTSNKSKDSEISDEEILVKGMLHAEREFNKYVEKEYGMDPAYFCIDLKGYLINNEFSTTLYTVSIDNFDSLIKQYERFKSDKK